MLQKSILKEFSVFLEDKMGLNFNNRWADLEKKLVHIAHSFEFEDVSNCLEWLMKKPLDKRQWAVLAFHLTVGETYFFRDERFFHTLEKRMLPSLLERHQKNRSLHIWSAGCCSGEEIYSIAILLHRLLGSDLKQWNLTLMGTDINQEFLHKAERARYKKWSFRTIPLDIKDAYFNKHPDGTYTLIPDIQKMVKFSHLNLVENTYPDSNNHTSEVSLILCHNVLIYFSEKEIKKTIHKFSKALDEQGILSVAPIEVPFVTEKHLVAHKYEGVIFYQKDTKHKADRTDTWAPPPLAYPSRKETGKQTVTQSDQLLTKKLLSHAHSIEIRENPTIDKQEKTQEKTYEDYLRLYQEKRYAEVISLLSSRLSPLQKDPDTLKKHLNETLLLIRTYANQGSISQGLEWCEAALRLDKLNPLVHYLQGSLFQAQGNITEAIKSLKRALFIDSNFIMAYYMLGLLETQQGNRKVGLQHIKIALELLQQCTKDEIIPGTEDISSYYLKDLINHQLNSL